MDPNVFLLHQISFLICKNLENYKLAILLYTYIMLFGVAQYFFILKL